MNAPRRLPRVLPTPPRPVPREDLRTIVEQEVFEAMMRAGHAENSGWSARWFAVGVAERVAERYAAGDRT